MYSVLFLVRLHHGAARETDVALDKKTLILRELAIDSPLGPIATVSSSSASSASSAYARDRQMQSPFGVPQREQQPLSPSRASTSSASAGSVYAGRSDASSSRGTSAALTTSASAPPTTADDDVVIVDSTTRSAARERCVCLGN